MRKIGIEFVRESIAKRGYKLLSTEYIDTNNNLDVECPKGHKVKMCWTVLKRGGGCIKCLHNSMRLDISFIRAEFKKEDYILLTTEYVNSHQKLDYICSKGHRSSISWGNWNSGYRCGICANNIKLTIGFIKSEFKKENWDLLNTDYVNNKTKLKYKCDRGHYHSITWSDWQSGYRCPMCWAENITGSGNYRWKGGIAKGPYCQGWTKEYKDFIKERDEYKCLNPCCFKKKGHAAQLIVHHIDHNKKSCVPENLITICRSCHGYLSKDQEWYESWYKAIMYRRYNYKY